MSRTRRRRLAYALGLVLALALPAPALLVLLASAQPRGEWTDFPLATVALDFPAGVLVAMVEEGPDGEPRLTVLASRGLRLAGAGVDPDTGRAYLPRERAAALLERLRGDNELVVVENDRLVEGANPVRRLALVPLMPASQYPNIPGVVILEYPDHVTQESVIARTNRIHGTVGPLALDRSLTMGLRLSCARALVDGAPCATRGARPWTLKSVEAWVAGWGAVEWTLALLAALLVGPWVARIPGLGPRLVALAAHAPPTLRPILQAVLIPPAPAPTVQTEEDLLRELGHRRGAVALDKKNFLDEPNQPPPQP